MNFADISFIFCVIALTTAAGAAVTSRTGVFTVRSILKATRALLDWAGIFAIFLAANLIIGALVILLIRSFTPRFITLYALQNMLLLILSAAQAFVVVVQAWARE